VAENGFRTHRLLIISWGKILTLISIAIFIASPTPSMNSDYTFRPAFYDDESGIVAIMNEAIGNARNAYHHQFDLIEGSNWFKRLRQESHYLLVCEKKGEIVGWGCLSAYRGGREAFKSVREISYYIAADHHRKRVGSRMIDWLENHAIQTGVTHLVAIMLDDNIPSRKLLEQKGFFVWGLFERLAQFESSAKGHLYMGKTLVST